MFAGEHRVIKNTHTHTPQAGRASFNAQTEVVLKSLRFLFEDAAVFQVGSG